MYGAFEDFYLKFLREQEEVQKVKFYSKEEFINIHINKKKYVRYCEAIMNKNGELAYVNPSHTYTLMDIVGKSRREVNEMIPVYESPIDWLIEYTGCVAIWFDFIKVPKIGLNEEQKETLKFLINNKIIEENIRILREDYLDELEE